MKDNKVSVDSKGRVLIPYHIRELHDIGVGSQFIIMPHHTGEIKLVPLAEGKTAEIIVHVEDKPGNLVKISEHLGRKRIDIIMSQMRVIERGHLAEWHAILDISNARNFKKLANDLSHSKIVKKVEIVER